MTASETLTHALAPLRKNGAELDALADRARGAVRTAANTSAKPLSVNHHLRLCVALGFDPFIEGRAVAPFRIGSFHKTRFGEVVRHIRTERAFNLREASQVYGVSIRALSYIENGHEVSIETVLTVCRGIGIHPFLFAKECFTGNSAVTVSTELEAA